MIDRVHIPLRKEFVTIGFSMTNKVPDPVMAHYRSVLVAIDDDDIDNFLKNYDRIMIWLNDCNDINIKYGGMYRFLLLVYENIFMEPSPADPVGRVASNPRLLRWPWYRKHASKGGHP